MMQPSPALARAWTLPAGLQLYSVREYLAKDYLGTLRQLFALGYREVEAAGYFGHTAAQVRDAMRQSGLRCVSAHYTATELYSGLDEILAFARTVGLEWIVCSFPAVKRPERLTDRSYEAVSRSFLLEDWQFNAEQFNRVGSAIRQAGMRFAYHNHTVEFQAIDRRIPFDVLLEATDPEMVSFELDCGWATVGGADVERLLRVHGARIRLLHLKDFQRFKPGGMDLEAPATELGRGVLANTAILKTARAAANLQHVFVEQEAFDVPWVESLRLDREWLARQGE